jgi:hypothetical protein
VSREEHLRELVRQGQALRQEDIDLGAKQERERIIKLLEQHPCYSLKTCQTGCFTHDLLVANIALIKGEYLEDKQTVALKAEIAELQNDLDRFGADMDICTCELIEAEIERLTNQLNGEK